MIKQHIISHISRYWEIIKYLLVGGWNTLFGIGLYALFYYLMPSWNYLFITIPVNVIAITNAFLCYKLFVFKSRGNWLREYLRCYIVYGAGFSAGIFLLWLQVSLLAIPPVIANAAGNIIVIILSFLGHKYYSFKQQGKIYDEQDIESADRFVE